MPKYRDVIFYLSLVCFGRALCQTSLQLPFNTVIDSEKYVILPYFNTSATDFPIGGLFELTSVNGATSPIGVQRLEAMKGSVLDINNNPNILSNLKLSYVLLDTQNALLTALPATIDLVLSNVISIVGPASSNTAAVVARFTSGYNVTLVSYASSSIPTVTSVNDFIEVSPGNLLLASGIVSLMNHFKWSFIIPLFTNDTYGNEGYSSFLTAAQGSGIVFDCNVPVPYGFSTQSLQNAIPIIRQISNCIAVSQATVVLLYMDISNAFNVLSVLYENPANRRLTFIGTPVWLSFIVNPDYFTYQAGIPLSFLQGIHRFARFESDDFEMNLGTVGFLPSPGNVSAFQRYFGSLTPENNGYPLFLDYWQQTFKCYLDTSQSIPACPPLANRTFPISCLCTGNESLTQIPVESRVAYVQDSVYSIASGLNLILNDCHSVENGVFCGQNKIFGSDIYDAIMSYPIMGETGIIEFNDKIRKNSSFEVIQLTSGGSSVVIGNLLSNTSLFINDSLATNFKGGTVPISQIYPDIVTTSSAIGMIVLMFASTIIFVSIILMVSFFIFRKEKVVKSASPVFCQLMLFGIILISCGLIIWEINPQNSATCIIKIWFSVLGFGLIIGNLLAKTYRIFRIFTKKNASMKSFTNIELSIYSGAVILLELLMLSLYTFLYGLPQAVTLQSTTSTNYTYIACQVSNYAFQVAMIIVILVVNGLMIICAGVLAYLTHGVESDFNESMYIASIVYFYIIIMLITVTIYFNTGDGKNSATEQFIERSFATIIALIITLVALFYPKMAKLLPLFGPYFKNGCRLPEHLSTAHRRSASRIDSGRLTARSSASSVNEVSGAYPWSGRTPRRVVQSTPADISSRLSVMGSETTEDLRPSYLLHRKTFVSSNLWDDKRGSISLSDLDTTSDNLTSTRSDRDDFFQED